MGTVQFNTCEKAHDIMKIVLFLLTSSHKGMKVKCMGNYIPPKFNRKQKHQNEDKEEEDEDNEHEDDNLSTT